MMNRIKRLLFKMSAFLLIFFLFLEYLLNKRTKKGRANLDILDIEFFHEEAGGFGGYGKTAKNITDYFNTGGKLTKVEIILARPFNKFGLRHFYDTDVIFAPDFDANSSIVLLYKYGQTLGKRGVDYLMSVEYCTDYQYSILLLPKTPLVVWIHDPRPEECLKKIATVTYEVTISGKTKPEELLVHGEHVERSLKLVLRLSRLFRRRVIFATTCDTLIERARQLYHLSDIEAVVLPPPVEIPQLDNITYSPKPSFCFLARIDPQKRPWIFFELAKRFPNVDFFVAGKTNFPNLFNPIIQKYGSLDNLKFLGHVGEKEKDELLKSSWGLVNTSIHEGLPISFLEVFAYGKPIISCQNPGGFVERFGIYTGEILGNGDDEKTINIFVEAINEFLAKSKEMMFKGLAARKFVAEFYSYERFRKVLEEDLLPRLNKD